MTGSATLNFLATHARFIVLGILRCALGAGMSGAALLSWANEAYTVAPELWDRPRSGSIVMEQPVVKQVVNAYLALPGASLVIRHAVGQESLMQAEELRAWLIALAVESGRINLRGDLKPGEPLKIEILR